MENLSLLQYAAIGLIFAWSGFVRTGLGFGGAVLSLPFLLLIVNDPLVFLPLIAAHLIFFSSLVFLRNWQAHRKAVNAAPEVGGDRSLSAALGIDWKYLWSAMKVMIVPKLIGIIGLVTLPADVMSIFIFVIISAYAVGYIVNQPIKIKSVWTERGLLALGGYVSGSSLTGAPLIIPPFAQNVAKAQLRNTLFVNWQILTALKLASFVVLGVNLQLVHHLWLLPCAFVGHVIGERVHQKLVQAEGSSFFRVLGIALLLVSGVGLLKAFGLLG
ncbi:MAG: TSUP family transporter [Burkholderiaceae bacterium]